ncbi:uncharacterized protein LOC126740504 isoform X3 [Anthonomus grandis grandis]|uniref:uncharacterized protein LOC126740504 isoform X3 n=1 Tax=Anthonomus grandis grandis TaxID=2921223 RepID=UPI0021652006|nr:uncharacterized protein LOC126740504 isoform X3 [Anthonomus grandis grandis]
MRENGRFNVHRKISGVYMPFCLFIRNKKTVCVMLCIRTYNNKSDVHVHIGIWFYVCRIICQICIRAMVALRMAETREDSACKVRELIFAYERQNSELEPVEFQGRKRAKSIGNALSYKLFREPDLDIHSMVDIEKELVRIEAHLNYYEVYEKETHVAFQEQLFNVLTTIVNIVPEDHESTILKKKELINETQKLARILNAKLPFGGNVSTKGLRRNYSSVLRKEEAVVTTTSQRSYLSASQSTINETFKSEDSLNSTRDSDIFSPKVDDSSSMVEGPTKEEKSDTVIQETKGYLPSVSRLKKFFSFRRDERPTVNAVPTTHPSISRSQSLSVKSGKYVTKNYQNEQVTVSNETIIPIISEEGKTDDVDIIKSEESNEIKGDIHHNISVSKLKNMFEDVKKDTDEGVGLLTKKQTELRTDFNILPYTEANLGALRLKRTISGNYMNFTGLLRKIDIQKKVDLNKSKSMSDLKSSSYQCEETNLSNEIDDDDDDDDNEDYVHVSIDEVKSASEMNNNILKCTETHQSSTICQSQEETIQSNDEIYMPGKVQILKKNFESLNTSTSKNNNSFKYTSEDINHIIHRTIDPIPNSDSTKEPVLKVPIQLRTGWIDHSLHEESSEDDVSHIIHRTIDPIPNTNNEQEEPILKVPIQLRGFPVHNETTTNIETEEVEWNTPKVTNSDVERTVVDFPQSRAPKITSYQHVWTSELDESGAEKSFSSGTVEILKDGFEKLGKSNLQITDVSSKATEEVYQDSDLEIQIGNITEKSEKIQEEVNLNGTVETLKQTFEHLSTKSEDKDSEAIKHVVPKVTEPVKNIDGTSKESDLVTSELIEKHFKVTDASSQLNSKQSTSVIYSNSHNSSLTNVAENPDRTHMQVSVDLGPNGTVETLKQTFEHLSTKSEDKNSENIKHVVQKVTEYVKNNDDTNKGTEHVTAKLIEEHFKVSESSSPLNSKQSTSVIYSSSHNSSLTNVAENSDRTHLQVPVDLRLRDEEFPTSIYASKSEGVSMSTKSLSSSREQLQSSTGSLQILQSPTAMATLMSSSSLNQSQQISSSSKVTVSYSQKTSVQHTSSTEVSHKVVSSSSLSSHAQNSSYNELYSKNSLDSPDEEESTVTITEIEEPAVTKTKLDFKLSDSQEQLLDDLIEDADSLHSYEDEFKELVDQYK